MDGTLNTVADARRRLNNSADGVASVNTFLHTNPGTPTPEVLDTIEYLTQAERLLRAIKLPGEA